MIRWILRNLALVFSSAMLGARAIAGRVSIFGVLLVGWISRWGMFQVGSDCGLGSPNGLFRLGVLRLESDWGVGGRGVCLLVARWFLWNPAVYKRFCSQLIFTTGCSARGLSFRMGCC